jgi:hypothetical protein
MIKKQESQKLNAAVESKSEKSKVESQKDQKKGREDEYEYDDEYYDEEEAGADGMPTEAALASGKDGKYNH